MGIASASKAGRPNPLIIYSGKSSEHLSFADRDIPIIGAFLRDQKKPQTNADRIRSMTDEELAKWFDAVTKDVLGGSTWNKKGWLKWLRAESEG